MQTDPIYLKANSAESVSLALAISGFLADNNAPAAESVAALMIVLMAATRPDYVTKPACVAPFIQMVTTSIAQWEPPVNLDQPDAIPEVPGGLSHAN